jgi:Fe-S-cluster-containing dehydrogenase component
MTKRNFRAGKFLKSHERKLLNMNTSRCTGCRSCEIACSYHHQKTFGPSDSSIRIFRNDKNGEIEYVLTETCDLCPDKNIPFCVSVCTRRALCIQ